MLTVIEPAEDYQLLTEEELRVAAGLDPTDDSQDAALATWGLQAASSLASACGLAKAGYDVSLLPLRGEAPLTLKAETFIQTLRVKPGYQYGTLFLARWPVLEIISVAEGSTTLATDGWELDVAEGSLTRLSSDATIYWSAGRVTVQYTAGYDTVPVGLKSYASRLTGLYLQTTGSDPTERRVEIPGVITVERWVDQTATDVIVPEEIATGLLRDGYRRLVLA
jgi:hypothetical protein